MERVIHPQQLLKVFFYEEVILLGRVFVGYQSEEDLIFRLAKMLDWVYRRHTAQIGDFENQTIEWLLKQPFKPHISTIYLLEKHFSKAKESKYGSTEEVGQNSRLIQQAGG